MSGRVAVEFTVIFLCGLGLHVEEVARIGGTKVFVQFKQVCDRLLNYQHLLYLYGVFDTAGYTFVSYPFILRFQIQDILLQHFLTS